MDTVITLLLIGLGLGLFDLLALGLGQDSRPSIEDDHTRSLHAGGLQ